MNYVLHECLCAEGQINTERFLLFLLLLNEDFVSHFPKTKTLTESGTNVFCSGLWDDLNHWCNNWFNKGHPSFWHPKAFAKHLLCSNSVLMNEWKQKENHYQPQKHFLKFLFLFSILPESEDFNLISLQQILGFILLLRTGFVL